MKEENTVLKDILAYERQLIADRKQLQQLLSDYQGEEDEIVRDKLLFFQSELSHMNHQYELLKRKTEAAQEQFSRPVSGIQQEQPPWPVPTPQPVLLSKPVSQVQMEPVKEVKEPSPKESGSLEKVVGSSLMGILASGLIFISLILFATLIMPYVGDVVKLCSCYLVSFVLIGVSLLKLKKDRENRFFLALAGCGVGALYITLLLTNIYFKYIGDILLFVLIAVWVAFVCYLSRAQNAVFHIIGQLGVTVSVVFGCILCGSTDDFIKFVSLTIFYVISFGTLYVTHFDKEVAYNKIGNIFGLINLLLLFYTNSSMICEDIYYLFVMLIVLAHLIILFLGRWEKTQVSYGVFVAAYGVLIAWAIFGCFKDYAEISGIAIYCVAMAILLTVEYKEKTYRDGQIFAQIVMVVQAWIGLSLHDAAYTSAFVYCLIVPVMLLGFLQKNAVFQYVTLVLTYHYLTQDIPTTEKFFTGLVVIVAVYVLLWLKRDTYTMAFKVCIHLLGIIFFLTAGDDFLYGRIDSRETRDALQFMLIAIYNVALSKSVFGRNLKTGEEENPACYNIINTFLMLMGLFLISDNTKLHIPVILVTLVIFLQNSKNLLERNKNIFAGIYVGFKFTILLVVILNSFDVTNYIISSLCILFAVAIIVLGFVKEYKSLRIYGLMLSMISVFKLIMVDIHYDNTLGNALSFFVSGVLCFAISLIYNYIDKKMAAERENAHEEFEKNNW